MKEDFAVLIDRGDGVRGAARIVDDFVSRENGIVMPLRPDRAAVPTSLQYGAKSLSESSVARCALIELLCGSGHLLVRLLKRRDF